MKILQNFLIGLGVVVVIATVGATIHHFRLKSAVESYKGELRAEGQLQELAQVIPRRLPPEKNYAPNFFAAVDLFSTNQSVLTTNWPIGMRGVFPGKAQILWRQNSIRDWGMTNSWEDVELALAANKPAFDRLLAITNSSRFDFNLRYEQRFEMLITNLGVEKKTFQKLAAKTYNDLRLGRTSAAAENIRVMLVLVAGTSDERTAISQLFRIAMTQIACAATWEFLQSSNVTDGQLAELQADWSQPEFMRAMVNVMPVELESAEHSVGQRRSSYREMLRVEELYKNVARALDRYPEEESNFAKVDKFRKMYLWRYWWSYPDELRYLKGHQVLTAALRQISTNGTFWNTLTNQDARLQQLGIFKLNDSLDLLFTGTTDYHNMLSESVVTQTRLPRKVMSAEVAKQAAITAIALKRFHLAHGDNPPDLKALVPEFLSAIPRDPVDGQPLRYRRNADGTFLLYSIGENGKDDGGDPALEKGAQSSGFNWLNRQALDWVWPQPATAEEIQKYFANQK